MADAFDGGEQGPVIRDKRRLDPQTGQVRATPGAATTAPGEPPPPEAEPEPSENAQVEAILADLDAAQSSAAERA